MTNAKNKILENTIYFRSSVAILDRAHYLPLSSTKAEDLLWERLRSRKMKGLKFRRQHAISGFIADFYCHEAKLILEIDGSIHNEPCQKQRDKDRTFELEKLGLRIIRFTNEETENDINKVLKKIEEFVQPHPNPSAKRDGNETLNVEIF